MEEIGRIKKRYGIYPLTDGSQFKAKEIIVFSDFFIIRGWKCPPCQDGVIRVTPKDKEEMLKSYAEGFWHFFYDIENWAFWQFEGETKTPSEAISELADKIGKLEKRLSSIEKKLGNLDEVADDVLEDLTELRKKVIKYEVDDYE